MPRQALVRAGLVTAGTGLGAATAVTITADSLRGGTATQLLMLTERDAPADRITRLATSRDDYLVKPFDRGGLPARIRALPRRPQVSHTPRMVTRELRFDLPEQEMRRSPGAADRRSTAQHLRDNEADSFCSNAIDVHLARLRSWLVGAGLRIETARGAGYRIVAS